LNKYWCLKDKYDVTRPDEVNTCFSNSTSVAQIEECITEYEKPFVMGFNRFTTKYEVVGDAIDPNYVPYTPLIFNSSLTDASIKNFLC